MEKFTASNGLILVPLRDGSVRWEAGFSPTVVTAALREFFLHERDQELGRWRWPENPDYVVYPDQARKYIEQPAVIVVNERDGAVAYCGKDGAYSASGIGASDDWCEPAARAYFAAHPESKPWHEAKHNEIWVLQIKDCHAPEPYRFAQDTTCADSCVFRPVSNPKRVFFDSRSPMIVDAHRIYPEASDE